MTKTMEALQRDVDKALMSDNLPAWELAGAAISKAFAQAAKAHDLGQCKALQEVLLSSITASSGSLGYELNNRVMTLADRMAGVVRNWGKASPTPIKRAHRAGGYRSPSAGPGRPVAQAPKAITPVSLGTWGEGYRGVPNELARSGLIAVSSASERPILVDAVVHSQRNRAVYFTGERLTTRDEDVLYQAFHFQRETRLGVPWSRSPLAFLEGLGWSLNGRNYAQLYAHLSRLSRAHVRIVNRDKPADDAGYEIIASTLFSALRTQHGPGGRLTDIEITMSPSAEALWQSLGYTLVNWGQRRALPSSLAKHLHRFYASHKDPFPMRLETLQGLTGYIGSAARFRVDLDAALQQLTEVGFLLFYTLSSDGLVSVQRA